MIQKLKKLKYFVSIFFLLIFLCGLCAYFLVDRKFQIEYAAMERIILEQNAKMSAVMSELLNKTQALATVLMRQSDVTKNFHEVAPLLMDDPAILNFVVAPDGVVSAVYPLKGNEAVLGMHFFDEGAGNREAVAARNTGKLVLGGPFLGVQGQSVMVGRLPVFGKDDEGRSIFWGLVSVTLKFPEALAKAELEKLRDKNLAYEIRRINPDTNLPQIIAASGYEYNKDAPFLEMPLRIFNADWVFRLSPVRLWYQYPETWFYIVVGVLLSLLLASLVQHNSDLGRISRKLEEMAYHDVLTGVLNRRGLFGELEKRIAESSAAFSLYYFDLDDFKGINDAQGHTAGDEALQNFAALLHRRAAFPHILGRVGGDEFVLVVTHIEHDERMPAVLDAVRTDLQAASATCEVASAMTFSTGRAEFPANGYDVDSLLRWADSAMYREKRGASQCETVEPTSDSCSP